METITKATNGSRFVEDRPRPATGVLSKSERHEALADWCQGLSIGDMSGVQKRWGSRLKAANAEVSGAQGGYLVPSELAVGVDAYLSERSLFRERACWLPMESATMYVGTVDPAQNVSGVTPLIGGFQMLWTSEATAPANSNPVFQSMMLTAHDLAGVGYCSMQLFQDGGEPFGAYMELIFAKAALFFTNLGILKGSGVGQPLGIVNAPGTALVIRNTTTAFQDVDAQAMAAKLLPACYPYAWWGCSPSAAIKIAGMAGFQSNTLMENADMGILGCLYGRPVWCSECLPQLGTQGDVILFDPGMVVVGCRKELEVAFAPEEPVAWKSYSVAFRVWVRMDAQPLWRTTATIADADTGFSPCVCLV